MPASTQSRTKTLPTGNQQAVKTSTPAQPPSDSDKTTRVMTEVVTQAIPTPAKSITTTSTVAIFSTPTTTPTTTKRTATTIVKKTTAADDDDDGEYYVDTEDTITKSDLPDTTEPCFPHECAKDVKMISCWFASGKNIKNCFSTDLNDGRRWAAFECAHFNINVPIELRIGGLSIIQWEIFVA